MDVKVNDGVGAEYFKKLGGNEFVFLAISRQGFRTAVEILADAAARQGKYVYVGAHLSGSRALGVNILNLRFADRSNIPTGMYPLYPTGLFMTHESFLSSEVMWQLSAAVVQGFTTFNDGTLMVCTPKPPEAIEYPLDFNGTVATVDADAILGERIAARPVPSGITALGLFLRATDNIIDIDCVKSSILEYDRLSKKARELNVETMQIAYDQTRVLHDVKIKGKYTKQEFEKVSTISQSMVLGTIPARGAAGNEVHYTWREKLPVCDQRKCKCIECIAVYFCPEGAISWKNEVYNVDYNFCKGCGTCAQECTEKAISMEEAEKVLGRLSQKK